MDAFTITVIILVALVIALVAYWFLHDKNQPTTLAEEARARARERKIESMYMDTKPEVEEFELDMTLNGLITTEIDDKVNGYGDLSDEQKRTINAIFDRSEEDKRLSTLLRGDSWTHSVYGDLNRVETIDASDIWGYTKKK